MSETRVCLLWTNDGSSSKVNMVVIQNIDVPGVLSKRQTIFLITILVSVDSRKNSALPTRIGFSVLEKKNQKENEKD